MNDLEEVKVVRGLYIRKYCAVFNQNCIGIQLKTTK